MLIKQPRALTHTLRLYYFPKELRYTTPLFVLFAILIGYVGYMILALIIIAVTIFILTAQYITVISMQQREIIDSFAFYGIDVSTERKQFRELHMIIVTKGSYAQAVNTRSQSRTHQWSDYTATLLYDDNNTLELVTREDKSDVMEFAKLYSLSLQVGIEDRSSRTISK